MTPERDILAFNLPSAMPWQQRQASPLTRVDLLKNGCIRHTSSLCAPSLAGALAPSLPLLALSPPPIASSVGSGALILPCSCHS